MEQWKQVEKLCLAYEREIHIEKLELINFRVPPGLSNIWGANSGAGELYHAYIKVTLSS